MALGNKTDLAAALTALLAFLTPLMLAAGERVEIKPSTTVELPRPRDFDFKRGNTKEIDNPSPAAGGGFITPPPAPSSAILNKELRKLQDKRDNWIFMRPEEILMDNKTAAFFKEKDNSFFEFKGMEKEKNAQEKYFEEREKGNNAELDKTAR